MPSIAFYGPRKVATDPLPGVRKTAAETPLSRGVGLDDAEAQGDEALAHVGQEGVRLGTVLAQNAEYARRQAEIEARRHAETAAWESENKTDEWVTKRLYGENGAMLVNGKDALLETDKVLGEYDTFTASVAEGLANPEMKENFRKRISTNRAQLFRQLEIHGANENEKYAVGQVQAVVLNKQEIAIRSATVARGEKLDTMPIGLALKDAVDAMRIAGPRMGLSPEAIEHKVDEIRTTTHLGVIDSLIAQKLQGTARAYFQANGDRILEGDAKNKIIADLDKGDELAEAQKAFDTILAGGGTLAEQRERAKSLAPHTRRDVTAMLEHEDAVKDQAQREDDKQFYDQVYATVTRSKAMPTDAATVNRLGTNLPGVRAYVKSLVTETPIETDWKRFYDLIELSHPETRGDFLKTNLWLDRARLGDTEFKQLTLLKANLASEDAVTRAKAQELPDGIRNNQQIIDNTLEQYKFDIKAEPGSETHDAIVQLRRMLDRRVDELQGKPDKNGKLHKLSNTEIQYELDELLKVKATVKGSWWGLVPFSPTYFWDTDAKIGVPLMRLRDVPDVDRQQIVDSFKRRGLEASDTQILDTYMQGLANKRRPKP